MKKSLCVVAWELCLPDHKIYKVVRQIYLNSLEKQRVDPSAFKGALSGLRQFLATESPLKMMENAF